MRFFLGLLTGGALTWAASLAVGDYLPSPGPAFRWLDAQLEAPDGIIDRIRGAPQQSSADAKTIVSDEESRGTKRALHESESTAIAPPTQPQLTETGPVARDHEDSSATAPGTPDPVVRAQPREPQPLPEPSDPTPGRSPESIDEPAVVVAPQRDGWESAWVPFLTQRSAQGFAEMLTRQVQHPFDVRREAAHRYRVTFAYADDAERERVLAAVRSITGAGS